MAYKSVAEMAEEWSISGRLVQKYCSEGRIAGALRVGRAWMVPVGAEKPVDMRKTPPAREGCDLAEWVLAARSPRCAKAFFILRDAEELYLRGEFRESYLRAAESALDHDARSLSLFLMAVSCLNLGDAAHFFRAEAELKATRAKAGEASVRAREAEFAQGAVAVNAYSAEQCPRWVADCDLSSLDNRLRPLALALCAQYALHLQDAGRALGLAEAALQYPPEYMAHGAELYLRIYAAVAASRARMGERSRAHMARALEIALPRGLVTPFAEHMPLVKSPIEPFEGSHGRFFGRARALFRETASGRALVRGAIREKSAELLLTGSELQIARLKRDGMSDLDIAHRVGASLKCVQGQLQRVYSKLMITSREELMKYIV